MGDQEILLSRAFYLNHYNLIYPIYTYSSPVDMLTRNMEYRAIFYLLYTIARSTNNINRVTYVHGLAIL